MDQKTYIIKKSCWLGKEGASVKLNPRQAANLVAGGFVSAQSKAVKSTAKGSQNGKTQA